MASTDASKEKILYLVEFLISERTFLFHWTSEMLYGVDAVYKFAFVNLITKDLKFYNILTLNNNSYNVDLKTKALDIFLIFCSIKLTG
jgi:hypothetical protein